MLIVCAKNKRIVNKIRRKNEGLFTKRTIRPTQTQHRELSQTFEITHRMDMDWRCIDMEWNQFNRISHMI